MTPIIKQPDKLQTEVENLEKAKEVATAFGIEPIVEVEGQRFKVKDPGKAGREIEPI